MSFATLPLIVKHLGTDGYGVLTMLTVVTNYVWFLDLGLGQATVKFVAEASARTDTHSVRVIFWTSMVGYLFLGTVAGALVVMLAPVAVYRWFQVPEALQSAALRSFRIGALGVMLGLLNYGPVSVLKGLQRFDVVNQLNILTGTLQPLLTVWLLVMGRSLPELIAANVAIGGATLLVTLVFVVRLCPHLLHPAWSGETFRSMLKFGGFLSGASLVGPLLFNLEKFLLANHATIGTVSFYMVPYNVAARIAIVPSAIGNALYPAFSVLHGRGEIGTAGELSYRANRYILKLVLPIVVILVVGAHLALKLWLGLEFAEHSTAAFQILLVAALVNALAWTPHMLVQALGYPNLTFRTLLIELVLCAPITFLLVREWGVIGAALAWLFKSALDAYLIWRVSAGITKFDHTLRRLMTEPGMLITLAAAAVLWISASSSISSWSIGWRTFLGAVGATVLVYRFASDLRAYLRVGGASFVE